MLGQRFGQANPAAVAEQGYAHQRALATKEQEAARRAERTNALQQQAQQAIDMGVPKERLPQIHGQMSEADMIAAQRALNHEMGLGDTTTPPNRIANGQPVTRPAAQTNATQGLQSPSEPLQSPSKAPVSGVSPASVHDDTGSRAPAPTTAPAAQLNPAPSPTAPTMQDVMQRDGTLAPGQDLTHTGAGFSTVVQSESGPRSVAVAPNLGQALEARFGGAAQDRFGKGWQQLSPDQRRQLVMESDLFHASEPVQPNYDIHGMTTSQLVGGGREYNPDRDEINHTIRNPDGSVTMRGPYGQGSSRPAPTQPVEALPSPAAAATEAKQSVQAQLPQPSSPFDNLGGQKPNPLGAVYNDLMSQAHGDKSLSQGTSSPGPIPTPPVAAKSEGMQTNPPASHPIPPPGTDIMGSTADSNPVPKSPGVPDPINQDYRARQQQKMMTAF